MKKIFSTKAGVTFNQETPNMTFSVRKDAIEIVYKVKAGVYVVLNLCRSDTDKGVLFADWGTYFDRLTNPQAQMPKLEKNCPTLFNILVGEDKDGISEMNLGPSASNYSHGLGMDIKLPAKKSLLFCLDHDLASNVTIMVRKMLKVYNELVSNPPFPAWKYALDDLWE